MIETEFVELNRKRFRYEVTAWLLNLMVVNRVTCDELAKGIGKTRRFVDDLVDLKVDITLDDIGSVLFYFGKACHISLEKILVEKTNEEDKP